MGVVSFVEILYKIFMFFFHRMHKAEHDGSPVVDVDGSYMYKKFKSLTDAGIPAAMPTGLPPPPISG